ncbi:LPXTG cell wall anchor domain-containing protein [Georgenia wangjunii]|uniref:LPXTG cell wall anchor domain-containing protein n=1 Tax=Georgenia wangjunii TaxID=3117730 RepID=UPI002F263668
MIRRAIGAAVAAAVIVLAPTAAIGYTGADYDAVVSTTNPAPGEAVSVVVTAPSGTDVTLTVSADGVSDDAIQIAGTKALTKTAVNGEAVFSLTLSEEGVYTAVATDADGNVIETFTLVVGDGVPGEGDGDGDDAAGGDSDEAAGPALPETGATATPLLIGGAVLLLVGAGIVFFMRRRSQNV